MSSELLAVAMCDFADARAILAGMADSANSMARVPRPTNHRCSVRFTLCTLPQREVSDKNGPSLCFRLCQGLASVFPPSLQQNLRRGQKEQAGHSSRHQQVRPS